MKRELVAFLRDALVIVALGAILAAVGLVLEGLPRHPSTTPAPDTAPWHGDR